MASINSKFLEQSPSNPVLVAEDNPVNQHVMALLFKQLAMQVEFASNGQEAVDLFS